ncbi:thioredoxin-like protein [Mycena amicta]|nr:thioredoxin-like protein [Mycena amicta]
MVLKLYGMTFSSNTRRVACTLIEKQVPFELVNINLAGGENKSPAYMEKQPFGQVPYIDDDGFILFESRAICRYIAEKYPDQGTKLIPTEPRPSSNRAPRLNAPEAVRYLDAMDYNYSCTLLNRYQGLTPNKDDFDGYIAKLSAKLDTYDVILGKQKYIGGDEYTLADLFHFPLSQMLAAAGSDIMSKKGPNVTRWFTEISARPAWAALQAGAKTTLSY